MPFLHNSLSRALGLNNLSKIYPGRDEQNRRAQGESAISVRPKYSNLPSRKSDVIDEDPSPILQQVASSAILSISNTLRSKARIFYVDSVKRGMDMPSNTPAEETSAIRPSSRSHTSGRSLSGGHNEQQNSSELTAVLGDCHEENQKFLELTALSPLKYEETVSGPNGNSLNGSPVDNDFTDNGMFPYLEPLNFESFRHLDFNGDDDCDPEPCHDGASGNESSDNECFGFLSSRPANDYGSFDFGFFKGDNSGATECIPWDLGPFEDIHSIYKLMELSENPSSSLSFEKNTLAAPYKPYQVYVPDSEGSSSSCSRSLSTEAQDQLVGARGTSHSQYPMMKTMEEFDTCSEHESDLMTELVRFSDRFKYRAADNGESGRKIELQSIETQSVKRGSYNPERPFNAAKLPQFNSCPSGNHVAKPSIQADSDRWELPPQAIPNTTGNVYEFVNFTDCGEVGNLPTLADLESLMSFNPSTKLSREGVKGDVAVED